MDFTGKEIQDFKFSDNVTCKFCLASFNDWISHFNFNMKSGCLQSAFKNVLQTKFYPNLGHTHSFIYICTHSVLYTVYEYDS